MHSRAPSQAKQGTLLAEKRHFIYKFVKNWGGTCPLCPPVPITMIATENFTFQYHCIFTATCNGLQRKVHLYTILPCNT